MGSIPKYGLRYRVGGLYASVNLSLYRKTDQLGEREFDLNFKTTDIILELSKNVYKNRIFTGINYNLAFLDIKNNNPSDILEEVFDVNELQSRIANLGVFVDLDYRNSIFTPDKGIRLMPTFITNATWTGSDFSFNRLNLLFHAFVQPRKNWISGFRVDGAGITDGAPFFAYPFLTMRGLPILRYQGKQTLLFETEQRLDLNSRWSMVVFGGSGKAFNSMQESQWNWAGGAGFRYLVARVFNLRGGIDVARGPEVWGYYIVLGHNWSR
jgi:hypothetical protein